MGGNTPDYPIVGIGASAGGLSAFKQLLGRMPADSGAAFILIQHLDPKHESMMADLLSRHTRMEVLQAENDMELKPNTIFVIPPGKFIRLIDHMLCLDEPVKEKGVRLSIDYFFRSLAEVRGEKAIGIVLSGTGTDGTLGIKEIKAAGGMVMVQEPGDAEYDGMPRSALASGVVDFVLPVTEMGENLVNFLRHPYLDGGKTGKSISVQEPDSFRSVLALLRQYTDFDFNSYKKGTVERRIQRRMGLKQIDQLQDYVTYMREHSEEVSLLFRDLLIGVTRFFREPDAWGSLSREVVGPLVARQPSRKPIRAWVPGCASGEEAYTLAMILFDQIESQRKQIEVQIFATDLNGRAIEFARAGRYPASIAADVPDEALRKYFVEDGEHFRVNKRLRDTVVFATQNVISDPPFSKLDIISCRNLMIYLESDVQQRMIEMFHFALAEDGTLFLGNSETADRPGRLFEALDKAQRIYRRCNVTRARTGGFPIVPTQYTGQNGSTKQQEDRINVAGVDQARRYLLDRFAPASVLVDDALEILYFHGPLRNYLDFPAGEPTRRLPDIVVEGLKGKLRAVLNGVRSGRQSAEAVAPHVKRNGHHVDVEITAEVVGEADNADRNILVFFKDVSEPVDAETERRERAKSQGNASPEERSHVEALEHELLSTREDLQSTIEEMETANEELKASNEEVMSMNEELQSTNEELETSREELQSLNEELTTVNAQLEDKVDEVEAANNDLSNLLTSTNIAVVFLDTNLVIRRFTPALKDIMRVIDNDVGRPVEDIALRVQDTDLIEDARNCLDTLAETEAEVETESGRFLMRRLRPYRTSENRIEGVVVTYTDITNLHRARSLARRREKQQEAIAELGRIALAGDDLDKLFNQAVHDIREHLDVRFVKILHLNPDGKALTLRAGVGWSDMSVGKSQVGTGVGSQAGYTLLRSSPVVVEDFRQERRFKAPDILKDNHILCGASVIIGPVASPWGVLGAHEQEIGRCEFTIDDVNFLQAIAHVLWLAISSVEAARAIEKERAELRNLIDALPIRFASIGADERYELVNLAYEESGLSRDKIEGMGIKDFLGKEAYKTARDKIREVLKGHPQEYELFIKNRGSGRTSINLVSYAPREEDGRITGFYSAAVDITEQRIAERESVERLAHYQAVGETVPYGVWTADAEGRLTYVSDSFLEMIGMSFEDAAGLGWTSRLEKETVKPTVAAWEKCLKTGCDWEREHRFVDRNGHVCHVLAIGRPIRDDAGKITSWAGFNLDITRRKEEEERLAVISAELDHRVKNILATVTTIARMTGKRSQSLDEYRSSLESRLQAMASAHQVLAESGWSGMSLNELLRKELSPYLTRQERIVSVNGPDVKLKPGPAQALALAFHELTTNAAKYGALGADGGKLKVDWSWNKGADRCVVLKWMETGMKDLAPPAQSGFGTIMLNKVLSGQFSAKVEMKFRKDGLAVTLMLPEAMLS